MSECPHDALLLLSFGGPEKPSEVMPFLERVTRGRGVPAARLEVVASHYAHFGGKSPINEQSRRLRDALVQELREGGPDLPVYWGNRHCDPLLPGVLQDMRRDGVKRALAFVASAYGSYSGCRAYLESIEAARRSAGDGAPRVDKLRAFFDHPGFVEPMAGRILEALGRFEPAERDLVRPVFTAHSIPVAMAESSPYVRQLQASCELVARRAGLPAWDLVWQSRSGPPGAAWLEPLVLDHLRACGRRGVQRVLLIPIGFVSDHMEVVYDLDVEAAALARRLGVRLERAGTVGTHPRFVRMVRELILEHTAGAERLSLSALGPAGDACAPDCCPAPRRAGR